jgi:hypothetical protein
MTFWNQVMRIIKQPLVTGVLFFIASLLYRFHTASFPFWVDEFSTAYQAKLILKHGLDIFLGHRDYLEHNNLLTHLIVATSFTLFGISEWSARLPFMLIGSMVPVFVWLLGKKVCNEQTGVAAGILSVCSYFLITWSRQARGYSLQILLVLALFYLYIRLYTLKKVSPWALTLLGVVAVAGVLTHTMFILALGAVVLHWIVFNSSKLSQLLMKPLTYVFVLVVIVGIWFAGLFQPLLAFAQNIFSLDFHNNLGYYHSLLWREYSLISFMALLGFGVALLRHFKETTLFGIYMAVVLAFTSFLFAPYDSRYLLTIFPLLLIFMAYFLVSCVDALITQHKSLPTKYQHLITSFGPIVLMLAIIANGHKFSLKPQTFYSVNNDFREIALIDYNQVYALIKEKGDLEAGKTAVIDTWADRAHWYLGDSYPAAYTFRWIDDPGVMKQTPYVINQSGEKMLPNRDQAYFIGELSDLQKAQAKYPKGFIWIDDSTLPSDVTQYVEKNFKKELYLGHYALDENPYSIWPGTLYSWGVE